MPMLPFREASGQAWEIVYSSPMALRWLAT